MKRASWDGVVQGRAMRMSYLLACVCKINVFAHVLYIVVQHSVTTG